ncbi:fatty acyl-AMP ligase [Myxococcota bacterium]|nr:fatty acyl-AMP ligase [Myxococcota bacterium]
MLRLEGGRVVGMHPTLTATLRAAAEASPKGGLRFLDRKEQVTAVSWAAVLDGASRVAAGLHALGLNPGERVGLIFPTNLGFFEGFFGALLAGGVPTPLYPPARLGRMEDYHDRTARMLRAAGVKLALLDPMVRRVIGPTIQQARPALGAFTLDALPRGGPPAPTPKDDPNALAMVQFSSGTTVDPKPVALTHRAVLAQTEAIGIQVLRLDPTARAGVSWLPLYHDMGLIGCVFPALAQAGELTLIGPEQFLARPALWLRALSRARAVASPAPNFAYAYCLQRITDEELDGVDLSAWRLALNGAEPVSPDTLRGFSTRFARWGLRPEALTPVYGLSEASLAVTFAEVDAPFRTLHVDRVRLAEGVAEPSPDGVELVSVGRPVFGFEVELRGPDGLDPLPEGRVGRLFVSGPSLMRGYLDQPEATARALVGGWLDTGDLGFLWEGELYLVGRAKDVLILRGRNHPPHPVEQAVDALPGVRAGCAAAVSFRPEGADHELLLLFIERRADASAEDLAALPEAAAQAVLLQTSLRPDEVIVLAPGTLPRTSSGKIRRAETLRLFTAGQLLPPEEVGALKIAGMMARSWLAFARLRLEGS